MKRRPGLAVALLALAALYAIWFGRGAEWFAVAVFAAPPLSLAAAAWFGRRNAGFWAGVLALMWFSHGVMVAWTRPAERGLALLAVALATVIVAVASLPGLRARSGKRNRNEPKEMP
ncbi:DUF2069 domain-containing protein [Luteimonas sp. SX5]|uniref:DUF2069 domain-containing protein n=1 Tax=Luteimonas galliterrae TaxID=2940486 RepID=A0ABT0MHR1_9GAMM|nr:DUF2069 domain-containing protein [Luteimonas galliterrae]MCL1634412.1 DUF2069 domain-containing protein [Luteimonas galliterrae]